MAYALIKPRRGKATDWTNENPILAEGEIAVEAPNEGVGTGLSRIKIGDGVTAWNDLPYAVVLPTDIKPTQIGLGNVNNTADADKNVKYAESAGSATQDANGNKIDETYATMQNLINTFHNAGDWGANIFGSSDVNTWVKAGLYSSIGGQTQNLPSGSDGWATVLVLAPNYVTERITQICWNWNYHSATLFTRNTNDKGANWSEWVAIVNEGNIARYVTKVYSMYGTDIQTLFAKSGAVFFHNWADSTNFPELYGAGIKLDTEDPTYKLILYGVPNTLTFYIGKYEVTNNTIKWDKKSSVDAVPKGIEFQIVNGELQYRYDTEVWDNGNMD